MILIEQAEYRESASTTLDFSNEIIPSPETNRRIEAIISGLEGAPGHRRIRTRDLNWPEMVQFQEVLSATHDSSYLEFLSRPENFGQEEILQHPFACPRTEPDSFISAGSWPSALEALKSTYLGSREFLGGGRDVYVLCRPPGHHAGFRWMGGFCYLNNAAFAAVMLNGETRQNTGVLDIDFHYGNGVADIVRRHDGLFYASLHCDRLSTYPFYVDAADQASDRIYTVDYREPPSISRYLDDVRRCLSFLIERNGCRHVIVSVGYDTVGNDPFGGWHFTPADFRKIGERIRASGPASLLLIQEGGYHFALLPECSRNFVEGLESGG